MTEKQKKYCEFLAISENVYKSARSAGYSHNVAETNSWKWVGKTKALSKYPEMYDYTVELREKERERIKNLYNIDKEYLKKVIKPITDAKIDDYLTWDGETLALKPFSELTADQLGAIESIKMGRHGIEFKLHGKSWSSDALAKYTGFYELDNSQQAGKNKILIEMPDNARARPEDKK